MAKILLKFEGRIVREYSIGKDELKVGRKSDNDIVVNNKAVSSYHCVIEVKDGKTSVRDLDSTNGTTVNDKRIQNCGLHQHDVIGIATHELVFLEDASHAAVAAHHASDGKDGQEASDVKVRTLSDAKAEEESAAKAEETPEPTAPPAVPSAEITAKFGILKVLKGGELNKEFEIKGNSIYIGKSDRAQIPIVGSGLFGGAPDMAASIHRKPEGFTLVAVEDGYPVVQGKSVSGKVQLKDGDIIECGGTTLQFTLKARA